MGEATKAEAKPYLAWLIGGDCWHVARDGGDGDIELVGWVSDHKTDMRIHDGCTYVTKHESNWPGQTTRPFAVARRIDDVVFGPVPVPARAEPTGWDVFGRVAFGVLVALALTAVAAGIVWGVVAVEKATHEARYPAKAR